MVHGDDFTFVGTDMDLDWIEKEVKKWFEVKVRARLGPGANDDQEVIVLGRLVSWRRWGIEYKADEKHRKILLEKFGMEEGVTRALSTNGEQGRVDEEGLGARGDAGRRGDGVQGIGGEAQLLESGLSGLAVPGQRDEQRDVGAKGRSLEETQKDREVSGGKARGCVEI